MKNEKKNLWYAVVRFRNGVGSTMQELGWNFEYREDWMLRKYDFG